MNRGWGLGAGGLRVAADDAPARRRGACSPRRCSRSRNRPSSTSGSSRDRRRPDLRRLGARARRQLQHGVRLPEPEPCRGARPLPVGAQNGFEPGPADRGQPTYFYPRENHFIFKVNVPKDWDRKKELVWTITANGKTETARATLLDVWEIDRKVEVSNNGGGVQISNELIMRGSAAGREDRSDRPRRRPARRVTLTRARHRRWDAGAEQAADAASARADAARRAAVAGQRAAAGAAAAAAGRVRAVAGLSRARPASPSIPTATSRSWTARSR